MENISYPQLVFFHGEHHENQVFYDVMSETITSFTRKVHEFIGTPILKPTNHPDWLITISSNESCLWNPVTLESINLPKLEELKSTICIHRVFLTKTPNHPDSVILIWMKDPHAIMFCHINGDHDRTWTHKDYIEELVEVGSGNNLVCDDFWQPIMCTDNSVFSLSDNLMVTIDAVKPLVIRPIKCKIMYCYDLFGPHCRTYLVACCSDMFMIQIGFSRVRDEIDSVVVLKLDFSTMSWNLADSCPNVAFFISGHQAISCPIALIDSSRVGNRVYFTCLHEDDADAHTIHKKNLYTYHIQQKKLKVSFLTCYDNAPQPYWIRVPNVQELKKTEEDYLIRGGGEEDPFARRCDKSSMANFNFHSENKETVLSDLPVEILRIIASNLMNPVDYLSFRATNKFCHSIGSAKEWRNILGYNANNEEDTRINCPWLMAPFSSHKGIYSMVDPISRNKYYTVIPETLDKFSSMCYSADARILMLKKEFDEHRRENTLQMWLYNPLTKYTLCLLKPPYAYDHLFVMDDRVVSAVTIETWKAYYFFDIEEELDYYGPLDEEHQESKSFVRQSNFNTVYVGGVFYLLVENGNLVYFSRDYRLRTHCLKQPCDHDSFEKIFLVKCDEDLLSIYVGNEWKWVRVFKFNQPDMVWERVNDLKNNIYVSNTSSIVMKAESSETGNRIYFPRFYQDFIIYYSLNTQNFHIHDGRNSIVDKCYELEEQLYGCWFRPTFKNS